MFLIHEGRLGVVHEWMRVVITRFLTIRQTAGKIFFPLSLFC